jgi:hypothetical protein
MMHIWTMLMSNVKAPLIDWTSLKSTAKSVRKQQHPYHLVTESPLPFLVSMSLGRSAVYNCFFYPWLTD